MSEVPVRRPTKWCLTQIRVHRYVHMRLIWGCITSHPPLLARQSCVDNRRPHFFVFNEEARFSAQELSITPSMVYTYISKLTKYGVWA